MSNTVYSTLETELLDGTQILVRPLSITKQRKANKKLQALTEELSANQEITLQEFDESFVDLLAEISAEALGAQNPDFYDVEVLKDNIDISTLKAIVKVLANWDFDEDPKAQRAVGTN